MKAVYESQGAMFEVLYDPSHDHEPITFHSMRVLDPLYQPVGPNLVPLFDKVAVIDGTDGEMLLSRVAQEIDKPAESGRAHAASTH